MPILREFLYRRDDLVAQFLEQLEGGEYEEERIKEQASQATGAGASAGVGPLAVSGERRKGGWSETEVTMRQTAASRFNRLFSLLEKDHAIQPLTALDDAIWDQIGRNEVIEVDAVLKLLPGVLEMHQATEVGSLLPLIETMKGLSEWFPESIDRDEADKISRQIPVVQDFTTHLARAPIPCTFVPMIVPRGVV